MDHMLLAVVTLYEAIPARHPKLGLTLTIDSITYPVVIMTLVKTWLSCAPLVWVSQHITTIIHLRAKRSTEVHPRP